jgi:ubiquinone/menaquinone biosynthesis C-methylase UbiE
VEGFLNPKEILKQLYLKKEMTAADFGSGSGGWAIPLAKILKDGKVYAIDILEEPLSALKNKFEIEGIDNIEIVRADVEGKKNLSIKDNSLDLVLITNLLFEVKDKKRVITEAKRTLKNTGKILVIDWLQKNGLGPEKRASKEGIKKIAEESDLKLEREFQAGKYHYGLVFGRQKLLNE